MADDEAEGSSPSFGSTIEKLSRLVRMPQHDKQQAKMFVDRIAEVGENQGFTDQQATAILQLALRGSTHTGRSINNRMSLVLLRSIRPARDQQFGVDFVLTIIGALGPADDAVVDSNASIAAARPAANEYPSSGSESDRDESSDKRNRNRRIKLAIGVQSAAVRLLVLLLKAPPITSLQIDEKGNEPADSTRIPESFLTSKARRTLDRCYDILFHFLDYQTLRPYLCHVLSMITRRKHVRHHRILKLMSLRDGAPEDAHLSAFIATCSKYFPILQLANAAPPFNRQSDSHPGGIRYPDSKWLLQVYSIWGRSDGNGDKPKIREAFPRKKRKDPDAPLRSRQAQRASTSSLLPAPSVLSVREGSILLTDVMTYKGLGYTFDRLQMPSHLICALGSDMLATAILAEDPTAYAVQSAMARIGDWAMSAISEEINLPSSQTIKAQDQRPRPESSHRKAASLLLPLGDFVGSMGGCTATLQKWTSRLLHQSIWNSFDNEEKRAVLIIMESFVPDKWTSFSAETLDPIKRLLATCSALEAALILAALTRLLEKWVVGRNWADISNALDDSDAEVYFGFLRLSSDVDHIETIEKATSTIVDMTSSLLLRLPCSLDVMSASLGLYECIFSESFMGLHRVHLPPRYPLHLLSMTQHGSISTLSRLFGIMKQIFDLHVEMGGGEDDSMDESIISTKGAERIKTSQRSFNSDDAKDAFNNCSVYLTDLVWRSNAFGPMHKGEFYDFGPSKAFFHNMTERCFQRGDELVRVGSMTHGGTLGSLMEAHANAILGNTAHPVQGPITPYVLEQASSRNSTAISYTAFRDHHLPWLADRRATGMAGFFYSTISRFREAQHLSYREDSMATSGA